MKPIIYKSGVWWGFYFNSFSDGQWICYIGRIGFGWSR